MLQLEAVRRRCSPPLSIYRGLLRCWLSVFGGLAHGSGLLCQLSRHGGLLYGLDIGVAILVVIVWTTSGTNWEQSAVVRKWGSIGQERQDSGPALVCLCSTVFALASAARIESCPDPHRRFSVVPRPSLVAI